MRSRIVNGKVELELQVNEVKEISRAMDFIEKDKISEELFNIHKEAKNYEKEIKEKRKERKTKESQVYTKIRHDLNGRPIKFERLDDNELSYLQRILGKL